MNQVDNSNDLDQIRDWSKGKPCVALMGEFSAGKSTLLNMLVGDDVVPTKVTATQLPAVWLTLGTTEGGHSIGYDGSIREVARLELKADSLAKDALIRMRLPSDGLREFDIIDTPGTSDPNMAGDTLGLVARLSDFVIWCTHSTQAWRQSEKAAWSALPERLRKNSILLVTRADKLKSETDVDKVRRRLERETGGLFRDIVFIATPRAADARARLGTADGDRDWTESGGEPLMAAIGESVASARLDRVVIGSGDIARPAAQPAPEADTSEPISSADQALGTFMPDVIALLDGMVAEVAEDPTTDQLMTIFEHIRTRIGDYQSPTAEDEAAWLDLLTVNGADVRNAKKALTQVRGEFADFAKGRWCVLPPEQG